MCYALTPPTLHKIVAWVKPDLPSEGWHARLEDQLESEIAANMGGVNHKTVHSHYWNVDFHCWHLDHLYHQLQFAFWLTDWLTNWQIKPTIYCLTLLLYNICILCICAHGWLHKCVRTCLLYKYIACCAALVCVCALSVCLSYQCFKLFKLYILPLSTASTGGNSRCHCEAQGWPLCQVWTTQVIWKHKQLARLNIHCTIIYFFSFITPTNTLDDR